MKGNTENQKREITVLTFTDKKQRPKISVATINGQHSTINGQHIPFDMNRAIMNSIWNARDTFS